MFAFFVPFYFGHGNYANYCCFRLINLLKFVYVDDGESIDMRMQFTIGGSVPKTVYSKREDSLESLCNELLILTGFKSRVSLCRMNTRKCTRVQK